MIIRYWVWYFAEKVRTQQMINVAKWMLKRLDNNQCRDTRQYIHPGNIVECDILLGKLGLRLFGWTQGDLEYACAKIQGPEPDVETGLVPCGCGGKAILFHQPDIEGPGSDGDRWAVFCEKTCGMETSDLTSREYAVETWNTAMGHKGGAE